MTEWRIISRFPDYHINAEGKIRTRVRVKNKAARTKVVVHLDAQRRHVVRLWGNDARARIVGVANLLMHAFKGPLPHARAKVRFLDGDCNNIQLENMVWTSAPQPSGPTRICLRCRNEFPKTERRICPRCTETNARVNPDFLYSGDSAPDFL